MFKYVCLIITFPGVMDLKPKGFQWKSIRWPDGTSYDGLAKDDSAELRGVLCFPGGDRYEGDFDNNQRSGWGVQVWSKDGTIYRGEWQKDAMEGCGVRLTRRGDGSFLAEEGMFVNDAFVGPVMACPVEAAQGAAKEADQAAQMARAFLLPRK